MVSNDRIKSLTLFGREVRSSTSCIKLWTLLLSQQKRLQPLCRLLHLNKKRRILFWKLEQTAKQTDETPYYTIATMTMQSRTILHGHLHTYSERSDQRGGLMRCTA